MPTSTDELLSLVLFNVCDAQPYVSGKSIKKKGVPQAQGSESVEDPETPQVKRKKYDSRKFKSEWQKDPKLKCFESRGDKAFCFVCSKVVEGSVSHLYRHLNSTYHKTRASAETTCSDIKVQLGKDYSVKEQCEKSRLLWLKFLCEHNLPFSLMDHLIKTAEKAYPDSKIAPNLHSGRTVSRGLIVNCIGKESLDMIIKKLRTQRFSLLVDESTDISTTKQLALVGRVLDDDTETVQDIFYT